MKLSEKIKKTPAARFLSADHLHYFNEGRGLRAYDRLGAHILPGKKGVHFAVWAPNAKQVSVIGDFNGWDAGLHPLQPQGSSGIWAGTVKHAARGQCYKYRIVPQDGGKALDKADPFAFCTETPPRTASVIWDLDYAWHDGEWMAQRGERQALDKPMSVYEVHLASWRRKAEDGNRSLSYDELGDELIPYVQKMGFTHVEIMPVMEHPFGGSWGYQVTGYFAPTRRHGDPQAFMHLIDRLHRAGIGVILDWVPSHFPNDAHGPYQFDGTHLFEHADPRQGFHPDWNSHIFNYSREEVRSFLISNAMFWLDKYHIDGLRVDAVASMLYLDYSRKEGEWIPNAHGGRDNLDAIRFLRDLNEAVYAAHPGVQMIAEESTAWGGVSRPTYAGGLGFGYKWDMGWMHDTLHYFQRDPVHRRYHQNNLTFRSLYAFSENFVLSLSHDEFVHGKGSLLGRMPGDDWQKFANLRALLAMMTAQPGKKLLFMGCEFAQWNEWNHDGSLDWHLTSFDRHAQIQQMVADLNRLYRDEPALHIDCRPEGFAWVDTADHSQCILSWLRMNRETGDYMLCAFNLTPVPRHGYRLGVPCGGTWIEAFNSDSRFYGGTDTGNLGEIAADDIPAHGHAHSVSLSLPPLAGLFLKWKK